MTKSDKEVQLSPEQNNLMEWLEVELKSIAEEEDCMETRIAASILDCICDIVDSINKNSSSDQILHMIGELCKAIISTAFEFLGDQTEQNKSQD